MGWKFPDVGRGVQDGSRSNQAGSSSLLICLGRGGFRLLCGLERLKKIEDFTALVVMLYVLWNFWYSTTICVTSTLGSIWTNFKRLLTQVLVSWSSGEGNSFLFNSLLQKSFPPNKKTIKKNLRHPLDRFLASYIDKLELGDEAWARETFGNLSWPRFVDRMLETRSESWNEHWAPIHQMCPPCIRCSDLSIAFFNRVSPGMT